MPARSRVADGLNVSALTPQANGATDQQCASWLTGSTISRYAPNLASVQMFAAGDNAWVLLYSFKAGPAMFVTDNARPLMRKHS